MSQTIKIKRSTATAAPGSLAQGELAYSDNSSKLFIGSATDGTILTIGGKLYTDLFSIGSDTTLTSNAGALILDPTNDTLDIDAGTVTLATQATEFSIIDNSATAFTITEGSTNYITVDTTNSSEKIILNKPVQIGDPNQAPNNVYTFPTQDGSNGQALITDGSGTVSFTTISTTLDIAGDTGTDTVSLVNDTFTFTGGTSIDTTVTNNTVTIDFTKSVDNIDFATNTISTSNTDGDLLLSPNGEGVIKVPAGYMDRTSVDDNTLAPKSYVDAVQQGLDVKESVKVATTANLSSTYNNGAGTLTNNLANATIQIDNRTLSNSDRVLVKDQSTGAQNGIYQVTTAGDGSTPWVLTRSNDADTAEDLTGGSFTFVEDGDTNADNGYVFTHNGTPTLGTTDLTVSQFSGAGQITAGNGLTKAGNQIDVNPDNISIDINVDAVRIKGITATAAGDLIYGVTGNGGFASLTKPSAGTVTANDFLLSMDTSGNPLWANVLDGGTY